MIVNIGGFGHSGNTAFADFVADHRNVFPLGHAYTETSLAKSIWGLNGILRRARNGEPALPSHMVKALLVGDLEFYDGFSGGKPTRHDFVRNRRVAGYLGDAYVGLVNDFVAEYDACNEASDITKVVDAFSRLISGACGLAGRKQLKEGGICVLRNDPAASNVHLLKYLNYNVQLVSIRSPLDIAFEWIPFYKLNFDEAGVAKFCAQFNKKADDFFASYHEFKDRIHVVDFDDLVMCERTREGLRELLGLELGDEEPRFSPEASSKNIGVGRQLDPALARMVADKCMPKFNDLKEISL